MFLRPLITTQRKHRRAITCRVFLILLISILFLKRKNSSVVQREPFSRAFSTIPLREFFNSLCCPVALKTSASVASVERRCSIRGRFRRTSIRSVVSRRAVSQIHKESFDFAEFGVEHAESAYDFSESLTQDAKIWLYDTFSGLPKASSRDSRAALGRQNKFYGTEKNAISVWKKLGFENIITRKGLFSEQLQFHEVPSKVAVLHCDGDLYGSINDVLISMYSNVLNDGAIIIDDWFGGHTGTWETARKAVYDFIISQGIAPRIATPLGMSAFWFKSVADRCHDCYKNLTSVKWSPLDNIEQMRIFKDNYQSILTIADSIFAPDCERGNIEGFHGDTREKLLHSFFERAPRVVHICDGEANIGKLEFDLSNSPDVLFIGNKCLKYDSVIEKSWKALPLHKIIILECWGYSLNSPERGCRPDFYRFVHSNGIMPLLTTFFDDTSAFWIKGPIPIG